MTPRDHTGTHPLTPEHAEIILTAPAGVDIYLADLDLADFR